MKPAWLVAPTLALATACAGRRPPDCPRGLSTEQCLWQRAQRDGTDPQDGGNGNDGTGGGEGGEGGTDGEGKVTTGDPGWARVDTVLDEGIGMLAVGLSGETVAAHTLQRCERDASPRETPHGTAWTCHLEEAPRLAGRELTLEVAADGLVSLAGFGYTEVESQSVLRAARERFSSRCAQGRFAAVETRGLEEFSRCPLVEGPLLVLGRFPEPDQDDVWQVSFTVLGAG